MQIRNVTLGLVLAGLSLTACGDDTKPSDECDSALPSCAGDEGKTLLGDGASTHVEAQESSNGSTPEPTQYVLETADGLAIEGSFEAGSATPDSFVFNSGTLGTPSKPGFPGVDIRLVVDGKVSDSAFLGLDSVKDFGYSSLSGTSFNNAALISGQDYVLRVTPAASLAGKDYTLEIRGHTAD